MGKNQHSLKDSGPLGEAELRETELVIDRHHAQRPVTSGTSRFDVVSTSDEPPEVTTRRLCCKSRVLG